MSGKTGVKQSEWNAAVGNAETAVSSVTATSVKELGKTTLGRFKKLIESERELNNILTSYQSVSQKDTQKMKQVAEKIVAEDQAAATSIQQNTTKVRFA